jgi:hypothetical protein
MLAFRRTEAVRSGIWGPRQAAHLAGTRAWSRAVWPGGWPSRWPREEHGWAGEEPSWEEHGRRRRDLARSSGRGAARAPGGEIWPVEEHARAEPYLGGA